jgi:hypothetical protein
MHSMLGHPVGGPHHPDGYPADYLSTGPIDPGHDRDCACGGTPACDPYPDPPVSLTKVPPPPADPDWPPF